MLSVSSTLAAALAAESLRFAWLINLPANIYLTDWGVDISYGGHTYISQGDILTLPSIVREREIKLQGYSLTLSGADQQYAGLLAASNRTGAECTVQLVLLDAGGSVVGGEAIGMYKGTFHTWQEQESGSNSTLTISLTSPWSKPNLTAGRMTSSNNQEDIYAGDKFFQYAHRERENIGWGAEK
ncbi:hypothetical protein [Kordiimonas pumila]|uniref:Uncharacterized protein n=1 Tax=Kordiimonas pumila TaxID=2161677 RepID=A0ABV7D4M4_9PROT|nr:hypothetical protein [Kordiimonas pumila]